MIGSIRVTNKRRNSTVKPLLGETVIDGDRGSVFGNPYVLRDANNDKGRAEVIEKFRDLLARDIRRDGPMHREAIKISKRILSGERIAILCWCAPKPCHLELVVDWIKFLVNLGRLKGRSRNPARPCYSVLSQAVLSSTK